MLGTNLSVYMARIIFSFYVIIQIVSQTGPHFYADNKLTDITAILGKEENFDLEAKEAAKSNKQFELITKLLPKNKSKRNEAIRLLSSDEKLLEMYNILLVSRDGDFFKVAETSKEYVLKIDASQTCEAPVVLSSSYYKSYTHSERHACLIKHYVNLNHYNVSKLLINPLLLSKLIV